MPATNGNTVKVHYRGTLSDGTEFDSSEGRDPLEFTLGMNMMIPGFEKAVLGLEQGDKVTVTIPAAEAYGEKDEEFILTVPKEEAGADFELSVGMSVAIEMEDDSQGAATITEITDTTITLDANHPLAGQDLTFEIEVVEIS